MSTALRKLSAIVVADVIGYSKQMAADELGTLERLRALRSELLDPALERHGGRLVKLMGDGLLAEFASAVAAASWAVDVQQSIAERGDEAAMRLRIGVNVGDVIIDGNDIYGDGVNVAARLEPLAPHGGVCISAAVHEHVDGKVGVTFVASGERQLKNIARPVATFCWSPLATLDAVTSAPLRRAGEKPSLFVHPFEAGGGGDAAAFASAVHEATLVSLSNLLGIRMLTDAAHADYVASATLQAVGTRYRATVRLVDRRSGQQFWSDRFDGDLGDFFEAQDDLAFRISTALRYSIYDRDVAENDKVPSSERTLEMLYARAGQTIAGAHREDWPQVGPLLDRLIEADPANAGAHAMKACWHLHEVFYGWRPLDAEDARAALAAAHEAVRHNDRSDFAQGSLALVQLYAANDPARCRDAAERALRMSPYYALGRYALGLSLLYEGEAEDGLRHCRSAADAASRTVVHHRMMQGAALAAFVAGRAGEALDLARRADHALREVAPTMLILAAAAVAAGREDEARTAAAQLLGLFPEFRLAEMRRWPFRRETDHARFLDALAAAGLPG